MRRDGVKYDNKNIYSQSYTQRQDSMKSDDDYQFKDEDFGG